MADPAHDEESNLSQINQDDAQPGDQDDQQTPGDPADARPEDESQTLESDGDDSLADSDPLALAQQESAPTPAKAAAVKAAPSPAHKPTITQPAKAAKTDDTPAADDDASLREALEDIPEDDWKNGRLTHKAKSQFLSQRKAIKRLNEQVAATKKVHEDLDAVEQLRRDQGLEPEEFVNAALLTGAMKRGDARAIPFLEQRLAACVQISPCTSWYRWQGAIEQSQEMVCTIKSRRDLFPDLCRAIRAVHPYQVPEILASPVVAGGESYLDWLNQELRPPKENLD